MYRRKDSSAMIVLIIFTYYCHYSVISSEEHDSSSNRPKSSESPHNNSPTTLFICSHQQWGLQMIFGKSKELCISSSQFSYYFVHMLTSSEEYTWSLERPKSFKSLHDSSPNTVIIWSPPVMGTIHRRKDPFVIHLLISVLPLLQRRERFIVGKTQA